MQPAPAAAQVTPIVPGQTGERAQKADGPTFFTAAAGSEHAAPPKADVTQMLDRPADVRSADIEHTQPSNANATAVRDVRLQVASSDNQRVDVRVMDRGGELRVSVRADDPSLVRSFRTTWPICPTRSTRLIFNRKCGRRARRRLHRRIPPTPTARLSPTEAKLPRETVRATTKRTAATTTALLDGRF